MYTIHLILHLEILRMKIVYTISEGKIALLTPNGDEEIKKLVRIYDNCLPTISFFHLQVNIPHKITSLFNSSREKGVILSVQFLEQNTCTEFESKQCWKMNYSPTVATIQLMLTSLPFQHKYESSATINRFDIFIPHHKATLLFDKKLLKQLQEKEILNLCEEKNDLSSERTNEFLHQIIKELEKPGSSSLCAYVEKFIQSVTL